MGACRPGLARTRGGGEDFQISASHLQDAVADEEQAGELGWRKRERSEPWERRRPRYAS